MRLVLLAVPDGEVLALSKLKPDLQWCLVMLLSWLTCAQVSMQKLMRTDLCSSHAMAWLWGHCQAPWLSTGLGKWVTKRAARWTLNYLSTGTCRRGELHLTGPMIIHAWPRPFRPVAAAHCGLSALLCCRPQQAQAKPGSAFPPPAAPLRGPAAPARGRQQRARASRPWAGPARAPRGCCREGGDRLPVRDSSSPSRTAAVGVPPPSPRRLSFICLCSSCSRTFCLQSDTVDSAAILSSAQKPDYKMALERGTGMCLCSS